MVDVEQWILLLFFFMSSVAAQAVEVEYISPQKQKQLEAMFNHAGFSARKDARIFKEKNWTCEMYGMRSRLQVQRGLKLYKWSNDWHNDGAQVVSQYKAENFSLVGRGDRFEDQVKITKDGQLISRLTLTSSKSTVLAYSVCKNL